jgi:hypothetical protein
MRAAALCVDCDNADARASCCRLKNEEIGDAGAKSLADALKSNTTLTRLS